MRPKLACLLFCASGVFLAGCSPEPPASPDLTTGPAYCYAGFCLDRNAPDSQAYRIGAITTSMGRLRRDVAHLRDTYPYIGPVTKDLVTTDWGQGSGTGLRLITAYLAGKAPA